MKRLRRLFVCMFLLLALPVTVLADCGPKESTEIAITGAEGEYYMTLLATVSEYGPHSAQYELDGYYANQINTDNEEEAWFSFRDHGLEGFYFWGEVWECYGEYTFNWGYYPPDEFKVAFYFPEQKAMIVSEQTYNRYAFTSGYRLDLSGVDLSTGGVVDIPLVRDYGFGKEIGQFLLRVVFTVGVELLLALLFYRKKELLLYILAVNVATQIGLNILLAVANFIAGPWSAIANLLSGELVVMVAEAMLYRRYMKKHGTQQEVDRAVGYAIAANLLSFILGVRMIA